jgi:hypothetical protein
MGEILLTITMAFLEGFLKLQPLFDRSCVVVATRSKHFGHATIFNTPTLFLPHCKNGMRFEWI